MMLKNYFRIAKRDISKNKLYTILHVFGLSLGFVCCLFIYLYIDFHRSFDVYHAQAERTFRLVNELHLETTEYNKGASYAMYEALRSDIPGVDNAAFLIGDHEFTVRIGEELYKTGKKAALTSSEWFDLFDYHWLLGGPGQLDEPNTMVLTAEAAKKYFGKENPIGKTVLVESEHPFQVVGVIDDANRNTSLKSDMYLSIASLRILQPDIWDNFFSYWGYINSTNNVFVSLDPASDKASVEQTLMRLAGKHWPEGIKYFTLKLLPLRDVHFDSRYGGTVQTTLLFVLAFIGGCIMVVASINYINISIAQQARRSTEIGMRRVLGGSRAQLFAQFMVELTIITFIALIFALFLVWLLIPIANQHLFIKEPVQVLSWWRMGVFSVSLWLIVSLGAGVYPAYFLGKLNIFDALKNKLPMQNRFGRQSLVVIQNIVAQVMIIAMIVVVLQVRFLKNTDVGFEREAVVVLSLPEQASGQLDVINNYLGKDSRVASHTFCFRAPASDQRKGGTLLFDDRKEWETWAARSVYGDTAYLNTFGIQLVAGRNFHEKGGAPEYLINEKMVSMLGFSDPNEVLGKTLLAGGVNDQERGVIVGVVRDFNTKSLLEPIEPAIISNIPEYHSSLALKLSGNDAGQVLSGLKRQWKNLFPNEVFDYQFLDGQIAALYEKEILQQKLVWIAATISVFISCLGFLGIISMMTFLRTKEIGIRKVMGASIAGILILLNKDFLRLVFIALLFAAPLAWWAMSKWLEDFAYRIELHWWIFALGGFLATVITMLTVSFQSTKAALANPVKSLRSD